MRRIAPKLTANARDLRTNATPAEVKLWRLLAPTRPRWTRQFIVAPYILDLACREARLAVELDGGQHATQIEYDARRTAFLEANGWQIIRYWNNDVLANPESIAELILAATKLRLDMTHPRPLPEREGGSR